VLLVRVLKASNRFLTRPWPAMFASWLGIAVGVVDVITGNHLIAGILFVVSLTYFVAAMFRRPKRKPAVDLVRRCVRCDIHMEGTGAVCSMCKQAEVTQMKHARLAREGWTFTKEGWVSPTPRCRCVPGTSKLCTTCRDRQDVAVRTGSDQAAIMSAPSGVTCSECGNLAVGWVCQRPCPTSRTCVCAECVEGWKPAR
jgi:hypothetical protein